ncbi:hypothetical protein K439DRAFT_1619780 [Ramaria rubella]|nr:hypothetical protein K439DRAFT_1619780 [Ramaria rubella]
MRILKGTDGSVVSIRRDDRTSFEGLELKRSEEAVTNFGRCRRVGAKVSDGTVTVRDCWLLQSSNRNDKFSTRRDGPITRAQAEGAKMQGGSCVKTARRQNAERGQAVDMDSAVLPFKLASWSIKCAATILNERCSGAPANKGREDKHGTRSDIKNDERTRVVLRDDVIKSIWIDGLMQIEEKKRGVQSDAFAEEN